MDHESRRSDRGPDATNPGGPPSSPLIPEILENGTAGDSSEWESGGPRGNWFRSGLFAPQNFEGGRIRVYGCSPGCLLISVVVSVIASVVLTLLINAII